MVEVSNCLALACSDRAVYKSDQHNLQLAVFVVVVFCEAALTKPQFQQLVSVFSLTNSERERRKYGLFFAMRSLKLEEKTK